MEVVFCVMPFLWEAAVCAATRQLPVRTLNPFGPIWMRSEDFSFSECPFYITHPPSSPTHSHTHTQPHTYQHAHSPRKAFEGSLWTWSGLAFGWDEKDSCTAVNMYSMYIEHI